MYRLCFWLFSLQFPKIYFLLEHCYFTFEEVKMNAAK